MARAFTLNFCFKGRMYVAVISQVQDSTTIFIPDENLQDLLPQGKVSFNPKEGLHLDGRPDLKDAKNMLEVILQALKEQCGETN